MHNWAAIRFWDVRDPLRRKRVKSPENSEAVLLFNKKSLGRAEVSECLVFRRFGRTAF